MAEKSAYGIAGEKIKKLRQERGWTQQEAAKMLNIVEGYLCYLENGSKHGSLTTYTELARLYDYPLWDLFDSKKVVKRSKGPSLILYGLSRKDINLIRNIVRAIRNA